MIQAENLSKWYGSKQVVNDVSFTVAKGEVLGFLGPNGAGKSTTMRVITGFLRANSGRVTVCGHNVEDDPIKAKACMGYLPENAPAYGDMTVSGFLRFVATLRGMSGRERSVAVDQVLDTCFLNPVAYQPIDTLSKGYLHRTCFAQAIVHDPEVLIMDEPTDGLDPNQKHEVRNLIKRMGERKAIIISTHILEEVDAVCSRVIVINDGKLVANGLPSELKTRSKMSGAVTVGVRGQDSATLNQRLETVDGIASVQSLEQRDGICVARAFPKDAAAAGALAERIHAAVQNLKWDLVELHTEEGRLDEVFREITSSDGGAKS